MLICVGMTLPTAGVLDVIVSDARDDAAETYLNQLAFSYQQNSQVTIKATRPDGSDVTFDDGSNSIVVRQI